MKNNRFKRIKIGLIISISLMAFLALPIAAALCFDVCVENYLLHLVGALLLYFAIIFAIIFVIQELFVFIRRVLFSNSKLDKKITAKK
jgi:hypothetical protein